MSHRFEQHLSPSGEKLNWLRASVLGANDGIVSIAGLVFGIAGASASPQVLLLTGISGIVAGAFSMAVGEYVSVSSSRDAERALLAKEKKELQELPEEELKELTEIYRAKGISAETATQVAKELTANDALKAHVEAELKIDMDHPTNPWQASAASALSFVVGAIIPLLAIVLPPEEIRLPFAAGAVIVSLALTGIISANAGGANPWKAALRVIAGGVLAMTLTYGVGSLLGEAF